MLLYLKHVKAIFNPNIHLLTGYCLMRFADISLSSATLIKLI